MGGTVASSVQHLNSNGFGYNIVIDRNGDIYQTAPFNKIVRHAGASNWRGWENLNGFSVGVCFANYGDCYLKNGAYENSYGGRMDVKDVIPGDHYNGRKKYQNIYWETFKSAQLLAGMRVVRDLIKEYQIRDVIRHDDVSIGRKTDTGPALDIVPFEKLIGDRSGEKLFRFVVTPPPGDELNLRNSYSSNSTIIDTLPAGTEVYVHSFAYRGKSKLKWCAISRDGFNRIGFVSSQYLKASGNFV